MYLFFLVFCPSVIAKCQQRQMMDMIEVAQYETDPSDKKIM